ncbi:AraC family transcriptional regulator [Cohnella soli]|uniref:AraC family transcriptional regulator n=1 Tax=Cohnella soli TaxID=425005 RepID=A0ABW0HQB2_9BACL
MSGEQKKVYRRIFISFIACIIITLMVTSTILYVNFENIATEQVYRADNKNLLQTKNEVSKMTDTVKALSSQIYSDYAVSKLLYYVNPNIYDVIFAQQQLDNYRASLPFIESIYVYNAKSNQFYISSNSIRNGIQPTSELDDEGIFDIFNRFKDYMPFEPIPRAYNVGALEKTQVTSYTYLCYSIINDNDQLNTAVVVNISASWLSQHVKQSGNDGNGESTFIMNKDGILYSRGGPQPMLTDLSGTGYIRKIMNDVDSSSYFIDSVDGVKSLVSYTSPDASGWRYVHIIPYDEINHDISVMRYRTLYITLGILLLGLLVSFISSNTIYRPMDKFFRRFKVLEAERRSHLQILKQEFLRNTILGRETNVADAMQQKLNYFGSKLRVEERSVLLLLKMDRYSECLERYKDGIALNKYAIMNICAEIASAVCEAEATDMGEDNIAILLNERPSDLTFDRESLTDLLKQMQVAVENHLKQTVSFTASPVKSSMDQCVELYRQLLEASSHRLFEGHSSILFSDDVMSLKSKMYVFPAHKEKQLVDSLMTGNAQEAKAVYCDIVSETSEYPFTVIQLVLSHVTLTINNVFNTLKKNNALLATPDFDTTRISLNHVETIGQINEAFHKLFDDIGKMLEEKRSNKHEDLVKKIHEIIERDYANPNLSLNTIADELSLSPVYLSRLYKQLSANALSDVIGELRMNKAKELLLRPEYTIAEIAERIGFTNSSYFYRLFKKSNGITPNDFRRTK